MPLAVRPVPSGPASGAPLRGASPQPPRRARRALRRRGPRSGLTPGLTQGVPGAPDGEHETAFSTVDKLASSPVDEPCSTSARQTDALSAVINVSGPRLDITGPGRGTALEANEVLEVIETVTRPYLVCDEKALEANEVLEVPANATGIDSERHIEANRTSRSLPTGGATERAADIVQVTTILAERPFHHSRITA